MAPRLILVSNRVNVPVAGVPRQAGGLTVAVNAALKQREGVWFGWSGKVSKEGESPAASVVLRRRRTYITLDLSENDFQEYYNGFANRVLWPVLHYRVDLAEFTSVDLSGYLRVNSRFADALSPFITPDDVVWVHDYHLLPFAKELRARGHNNPIGFLPAYSLPAARHRRSAAASRRYDGRAQPLRSRRPADGPGRRLDNLSRYFAALGMRQ